MKYYDDKASYRSLSAEESANYRDARDRELRKKYAALKSVRAFARTLGLRVR